MQYHGKAIQWRPLLVAPKWAEGPVWEILIQTHNSKAFQAFQELYGRYTIKSGLLLVRENEISLGKWSVGAA